MKVDAQLNSKYLKEFDNALCQEIVKELKSSKSMSWEYIFMQIKYLCSVNCELLSNQEKIHYFNECYNHGLSIYEDEKSYLEARQYEAALYYNEKQYDAASNCILAVLDCTDDVPIEMLLTLNAAQLHTENLVRVLKHPKMFFNDVHSADGNDQNYVQRQKNIIKDLLVQGFQYKKKDPNAIIDMQQIEQEVSNFGLIDTVEWKQFKSLTSDNAIDEVGKENFIPKQVEIFTENETEIEEQPIEKVNDVKSEREYRPFFVPIFKENKEKVEKLVANIIDEKTSQQETDNEEIKELITSLADKINKNEQELESIKSILDTREVDIEEEENYEMTDEEKDALSGAEQIIVVDTCSLMHEIDLLDYVSDNEIVKIPKIVIKELEHHKKHHDKEQQNKGQRALKSILLHGYCEDNYEDDYADILNNAYKLSKEDDITTDNDKRIFSIAYRYKTYSNIPVLIISDDDTMRMYAQSEGILQMTAAEFVASRSNNTIIENSSAKDNYLSKKLKVYDFHINDNELLTLQNNGIFTYSDFLNANEEDISNMKNKKGINLGNRLIGVQQEIKTDYDLKFNK